MAARQKSIVLKRDLDMPYEGDHEYFLSTEEVGALIEPMRDHGHCWGFITDAMIFAEKKRLLPNLCTRCDRHGEPKMIVRASTLRHTFCCRFCGYNLGPGEKEESIDRERKIPDPYCRYCFKVLT